MIKAPRIASALSSDRRPLEPQLVFDAPSLPGYRPIMIDSELAELDLLAQAELVKRGEIQPEELLDAAMARLNQVNPTLNAISHNFENYARRKIKAGLPDGPLKGVPFPLKDLHASIEGLPISHGCNAYRNFHATRTSTLVQRYESAGLVICARTASPEFGLTVTTEPTLFGPTRNPWNTDHSSGGSSGGASSAVASGMFAAGHASDGGGSIRIPAACCGLFGLKPSRGRTPMGPVITEGWLGFSVSHAVTRSVRDSAALLDAVHGWELGQRAGPPAPIRPYIEEVGINPAPLRIAMMVEPFSGATVHSDCKEAVLSAAKLLESLGHGVEEAAPAVDYTYIGLHNLDIIAAHTKLAVDQIEKDIGTPVDISSDLEEATRGILSFMEERPPHCVAEANSSMQRLAIEIAEFQMDYDIIMSPVLAQPPAKIGIVHMDQSFADYGAAVSTYSPFTSTANQTGQPAMSVPLYWNDEGLPIGVMFMARLGREDTLLQLAGQLERARPWADRKPSVWAS